MERGRLARFGLVFGLAGLFGCAPLPTPQVAVAPAPVSVPVLAPMPPPPPPAPPAPVVLVPAPAPVAVVPPPPPAGPVVAAHPVMHHRHWRRYAAVRTDYYGPSCGSVAHPCSVYHTVVPIQ